MKEPKASNLQTIEIIGLAFSAVVGSVAGAVTTLFLISNFGVAILGDVSSVELKDKQVESKIIELLEDESATIAVVERVTPAVASIVVKKELSSLSESSRYYFGSPFFASINGDTDPSQLIEVSSGTGFFVTSDGYMITNKHVIDEDDASYFVVTNDGDELEAELIDADSFQDIAILRVEGEDFPVASLGDSDDIRIGQTVIAIGNTLSEFRNTVTKGVVSGIDRRITAGDSFNADVIDQAIQTDAAINPGNSGGPLINLLGEVIGINTAVSFEGEAVAFAIPINEAKRAIEDVLAYGRIIRPWLGVRYVLVEQNADSTQEIQYELGALILSGDQPGEVAVFEGSPADKAGLQEGDIIININNVNLIQDLALAEAVSEYRPGEIIKLGVLRDQEFMEIDVELEEYSKE
jgi:serine protease Do